MGQPSSILHRHGYNRHHLLMHFAHAFTTIWESPSHQSFTFFMCPEGAAACAASACALRSEIELPNLP
ncbi:hypothetical protein RHGRI_032585 [Rhododendron griersonianum]|uniref:Uncharacterized protein n=1 Tax=Rhododendron griersonianum TaxID=479676 RepID=A0AAV6II56_9ERIC|nr:hypothetical protein RHGRI_032585 [Rhododendron griersonianum]